MFKVLIIACSIFPFPRGEILTNKCFIVEDKWQPSLHGYPSKEMCLQRIDRITKTIRDSFSLLELKTFNCRKTVELS